MQELGYSFSLTTFSPTGQLWQIQHAIAATNRGRLTLCASAQGASILLIQRKIDEQSEILIDQKMLYLVYRVSDRILAVCSGLQGDSRAVVNEAREIAVGFQSTYGSEPTAFEVATQLSKLFYEKTREGGVRPFGVCCIIADSKGCYQINPSGSFYQVKAFANGQNSEQARSLLEKRFDNVQTLTDAAVMLLGIAREVSEIDLGCDDFVMGICQENTVRIIYHDELEGYWRAVE